MITKNLHIKSFAGFLFLLLVTASCSNDEEAFVMPSSEGVKLEVTTEDDDNATTRTAGDNSLNENLFVTLDYYFFAANDEQATLKVKLSEGNLTDNTRHVYSGRRLTDAELEDAFGKSVTALEGGEKCYVYVVANLPVDKLDANIQTAIANKTIKLEDLKKAKFQTTDISKNGVQASFVMYGGANVTLSVTGTGTDRKMSLSGQVRVKRDAAKVVLTVTQVSDTVHLGDKTTYQVWQSDPDNMHVMFYYGVNKSTIHSQINPGYHYEPSGNADDCYFTLNGMEQGSVNPWRILDQGSDNTNRTHQYPFYTYLSDWSDRGNKDRASYMILMVPWKKVKETTTGPTGETTVSGTEFEYTFYQIETTLSDEHAYYENTFYQIQLNVGVLGSFELPEPVVVTARYMVVPWGTVDVPGTLREGKYLILETREYTMNNINSASIPYISSHAITQAYVTKVEYVNTGNFSHETINNPRNPGGTADTDGDYTTNTYVNNERFVVSTNDNKLTLNHTISPDQFTRYDVTVTIKNAADLEDQIVFTIYPAIYADIEPGDNVFINGRFGHVQNPPSSGNSGWYPVTGNYYRSSQLTNNTYVNVGPGNGETSYGSLVTSQTGAQVSLTRITVTSFSDNNGFNVKTGRNGTPETRSYVLTDPRELKADFNSTIVNYWETRTSNRDSQNDIEWRTKSNIMVGSSAGDVIAPQFLISSTWGRTQGMNGRTFENSEKRCATYQEAGYPAGRWRLPTEAELCFIYGLQNKGIIPELFKSVENNPYWASSGRGISGYDYDARNDVHVFLTNPNRGDAAGKVGLRCVYDLWYWGETPYKDTSTGINVYHAEP